MRRAGRTYFKLEGIPEDVTGNPTPYVASITTTNGAVTEVPRPGGTMTAADT